MLIKMVESCFKNWFGSDLSLMYSLIVDRREMAVFVSVSSEFKTGFVYVLVKKYNNIPPPTPLGSGRFSRSCLAFQTITKEISNGFYGSFQMFLTKEVPDDCNGDSEQCWWSFLTFSTQGRVHVNSTDILGDFDGLPYGLDGWGFWKFGRKFQIISTKIPAGFEGVFWIFQQKIKTIMKQFPRVSNFWNIFYRKR